jgi:S-adenosylmethionine/arginine decarboxylase-like enzyme
LGYKTWGKEIIIDASQGDVDLVTNPVYIKNSITKLVNAINMEQFGETQVFHFGEHDEVLSGWTSLTFLTTSSICIHFCDKGDAYINVFSCKDFDPTVVSEHFITEFGFKQIKSTVLDRQA